MSSRITLTEAQLRDIVRRGVKKRLEEDARYEEGMNDFADAVARKTLAVLNNAGSLPLVKSIERSWDWESAPLPARYEDIEAHAYEIADRVSERLGRVLHPYISNVVLQVIRKAM